MRVMKFEGANMRDAVAKVKAELGDQAVIVSSRQIRKGLLGTACEISAAIDDDDDSASAIVDRDDDRGPRPTGANAYTAPASASARAHAEADFERTLGPLRGEIKSLRSMIRASSGDSRATTELRQEVVALRRLVEELRSSTSSPPPPAAPAARGSSQIATSSLIAPGNGRVRMLVGPTGVGKTTTTAKLAARAALVDHRNVQVITLDSYRVGGVDQIRTFTDLIGVPLSVCESPRDLAAAIDPDADLTLIDTAGRSPRDTAAIRELSIALAAAPAIETHLVITAGTSAAAIDDIVARYRPLAPARLLFTKLDEVDGVPELSRAPIRHALPITWVTTGQAVPEDLEEPTVARVLELASAGLSLRSLHGHAA